MLGKALARLEKEIAGLDCRRTLFLSHDHARRAPRAHAAALASFLGASDHRLATFFGKRDVGNVSDVSHREPADCVARVKPWLPRLRAYFRRADIPRRRVAATPRLRRGYSVGDESRRRRGCDVEIRSRLARASGTPRG